MKTYHKPATIKLVARIDRELKNILMNDLKAVKAKNQFLNGVNNQLTAA